MNRQTQNLAISETGKFHSAVTRSRQSAGAGGFTLIELIVVMGIIVLVASIALPSITSLFNRGDEAQAFNVFNAMLSNARAVAVVNGTYAAVHGQMDDGAAIPKERYYMAVMWINPNSGSGQFELADGYSPHRVPGSVAFGKITDYFVSGNSFQHLTTDNDLADFTNFTVVFAPNGEVVKQVNKGDVEFDSGSALFSEAGGTKLWDTPADAEGVTAVTLFDFKELKLVPSDDRATYLDDRGQFLPVNPYTGQLFQRR